MILTKLKIELSELWIKIQLLDTVQVSLVKILILYMIIIQE